jgi:hypothetical protein
MNPFWVFTKIGVYGILHLNGRKYLVSYKKNFKKELLYFLLKLLYVCLFGHHKFSIQL